jgi:hypothetical protein
MIGRVLVALSASGAFIGASCYAYQAYRSPETCMHQFPGDDEPRRDTWNGDPFFIGFQATKGAICGAIAGPIIVPAMVLTSPFWMLAMAHRAKIEAEKAEAEAEAAKEEKRRYK